MITYDFEGWDSCKDEVRQLCVAHWEEIALNKDVIPLDPDWERYAAADKAGSMVFVTCRDNGRLIGYSIWFITKHLHYKQTTWAYNDVIFLLKPYRKGRIGLKLINFSEYYMKVLGADKIAWHVKVTNDWTPILRRMGYVMEDIVMGKVV